MIYSIDSNFYGEFVTNIIYEINDTAFARTLLHHPEIEESMLYEPSIYLLSKYSQEILETF